ncbi:hypothetical protein [Pseudomonas entomophila]|uniref:Uncharacterized protein n=2 Tax=Pseudomonas entomophila TaxID=312306 RepID=Q1I3V7_PSEE4|nr:hypothetical protein [Pseudomonas entomophila]WMW06620.1 hypothetical protein RAH46_04590 [Pseudomonas entomophila]CAK17679.1 hypothetical protein PSEEN5046 [Pseudomonas entomophila L48]
MIYQKRFASVSPQLLEKKQPWRTSSGLQIKSNGSLCTGFWPAAGQRETELIIGSQCDVEISFAREVDSLAIEFYAVCDDAEQCPQTLLEIERPNQAGRPDQPGHFFWLTLAEDFAIDSVPGAYTTEPRWQILPGPLRRLTLSTSPHAQLHIRNLKWTPVRRQ